MLFFALCRITNSTGKPIPKNITGNLYCPIPKWQYRQRWRHLPGYEPVTIPFFSLRIRWRPANKEGNGNTNNHGGIMFALSSSMAAFPFSMARPVFLDNSLAGVNPLSINPEVHLVMGVNNVNKSSETTANKSKNGGEHLVLKAVFSSCSG